MELLLTLSQDNLDMAKFEAETIFGSKLKIIEDNLVVVKSLKKGFSRLAFTHSVNKIIAKVSIKNSSNLSYVLNKINWNKYYNKNFKLNITNHSKNCKIKLSPKKIAEIIWDNLKKPVANMKTPETIFEIIVTDSTIFITKRLWTNDKSYNKRKAHLRPELHPSSLAPKLAIGCLNMTGATKGDVVLDPFCGSGGILIEAGFLGFLARGFDINRIMRNRSQINLKHYNLDEVSSVIMRDSFSVNKKYNYIVTDLPYGKNTKKIDLDFFENFFVLLTRILKKRAVVLFPSTVNSERLIKKHKFKIIKKFDYYLHKSLSKKIYVLEK